MSATEIKEDQDANEKETLTNLAQTIQRILEAQKTDEARLEILSALEVCFDCGCILKGGAKCYCQRDD